MLARLIINWRRSIVSIAELRLRVNHFIKSVEDLEVQQRADIRTREQLEASVRALVEQNKITSEELDICTNAITILREVSDEAVQKSYEFIMQSINAALERIFEKTTRKIRLKEWTRNGQYPQLEIELIVESGKTRSLKADSGHGLMQIISLLCILSLIVITHSRRTLWIDEIISGLSSKSRRIVAEILWSFTQIGFQFVVSEHGFIPKGSKVYHLQMDGGISHVENEYIETEGVYLNGVLEENKEYRGEVQGEIKSGHVVVID